MLIVNKFGGEIIGNHYLVKLAVKHLKEQLKNNQKPVVVVSALARVTDKLLKLSQNYNKKILNEIINQHEEWLNKLGVKSHKLDFKIDTLKKELEKDIEGGEINKSALQDKILSYGEKFSSLLFAELLLKYGIPATRLTGEELGVITDNNFGDADIKEKESLRNIKAKIKSLSRPPVIAGFIGKTSRGQTTTLGRGGSDATACLVGAALSPSKIILWKNVPGVLSADPKIVKNPKTIKALTYGEAEESGKVIHDKAIDLIRGKNVRVEVAYIADPSKKTIVDNNATSEKAVKIISSKDNLQMFIISSERITRPGALYEIANIISKEGINMVFIRNTKESLYIVVEKNAHNLTNAKKMIEDLGYRILAKEVSMVNAVGQMNWKTAERFNHLLYHVCPETDLGAFPYKNCLRLEAIVDKPKVNKLINKFHKEFICK